MTDKVKMNMERNFPKLSKAFVTTHEDYLKLIPNCKQLDKNDVNIIYKALYVATKLHENSKKRKSGEDYITHPVAVSSLLANFGLDGETVVGALLHDVVEDTEYTLKDCEREFGSRIATLVDGVTKVGHDINSATHDKIVRSIVDKDVRCYGIKGADRLHNMYTLGYMKLNKQIDISNETLDFYITICKILGIYKLKDELQDLCLYHLDNESFEKYKVLRGKLKEKYKDLFESLGTKTQEKLSKLGVGMRFDYRIKNIGALYEEVKNGLDVYDIDDLLAIKMVVTDPSMCYQTLGIIHELGSPINGSFEDFIAVPKENGYKSLNTNIKYKDANIQVRIRTEDMQKSNDLGVFSDLNSDMQSKVNESMRKSLYNLIT